MPKCSECGFLAYHDEYPPNEIPECRSDARKTGMYESSLHTVQVAKMFCYAGSNAFPQKTGPQAGDVAKAISQDVACERFCVYRTGKTPKEHEDMDLLAQVRLDNYATIAAHKEITERHHAEVMAFNQSFLDFKKELATAMAKARSEDAASAAAIRTADIALASTRRKQDRSLSMVSLVVSGLAIIITAAIGLIQAGKLFWPDMTK